MIKKKQRQQPIPGQTVVKSLKEALDMIRKVMAELHLAHIGKGKKR